MKYNWKKALANALMIFIGIIIAKIGTDSNIHWTWLFWKPILSTAGSVTFFAELRYIYKFLGTIGGNNATKSIDNPTR